SAGTFSCTPDDTGTYVVTLVVKDIHGATSAAATATIPVGNLNPIASIVNPPATGTVGAAISLTSSVDDPGPADVAAGFGYSWVLKLNGVVVTTANTANFNFTPAANGVYSV